MKFGVNTFVWVSPCTTDAVKDLAPKVKAMGFDILELSVENPALIDVKAVKEALKENRLEGIICGASAIYTGVATLLNEVYGKAILPVG